MAKAKKAKATRATTKKATRADSPKVTLRFHGRFLFANPLTGDERTSPLISAVAVQYDERGAGKHLTLMTIRHSHVVFQQGGTRMTTFDPHFRVTSPVTVEGNPELLVWDLAGLTVSYNIPGPSSLLRDKDNPGEVYRLIELEGLMDRSVQLDTTVLRPDRRRSNAVVVLTKAAGFSESPPEEIKMHLASEADVRKGGQVKPFEHPKGTIVVKRPADLVRFEVEVPNVEEEQAALILTCTTESGEIVGTIALKKETVIGISNACSQIEEPPKHDLEFSRYYDLMTAKRPGDVLVPMLTEQRLMEGLRCYMVSTISYNET